MTFTRLPTAVLRRALLLTALFLSGATGLHADDPAGTPSLTPPEYRRAADQTFLTFPEWFLVYSSNEYAAILAKDEPPSSFPFFGHLREFWTSYGAVYQATKDDKPFNSEYHTMILVIGVSTSLEYAIHDAYESLFGRLAEAMQTHGPTEEDTYAARTAQAYVDFIRMQPWYEFDFTAALTGLWRDTSLWGPDLFRKWERKYALTTEYLVKAAYGHLLRIATRSAYDVPSPLTAIVVDHAPAAMPTQLTDFAVLQTFPDNTVLATVPRYDAFKRYAMALAIDGVQFREIAGNRSDILVSVLAREDWQLSAAETKVLFTQPILTEPGTKRTAFTVPVTALGIVLTSLNKPDIEIERIYDY